MEILILIIMLLVVFSFWLKLTCCNIPVRVAICFLIALFVGLSCTFAAEQSKTQIAMWIQDPGLMLDLAVLLTVDGFLQIAFCVTAAGASSGERYSRWTSITRAICLCVPGVLIFPVVLAMLVEVIFSFPGVDFRVLSWSLGVIFFIVSLLTSLITKKIIPEKDLRLELVFMVNVLIAMLGILVTVNGRTAVQGVSSLESKPLLGVLSLFFVVAVTGYLLYKRKLNKLINKSR